MHTHPEFAWLGSAMTHSKIKKDFSYWVLSCRRVFDWVVCSCGHALFCASRLMLGWHDVAFNAYRWLDCNAPCRPDSPVLAITGFLTKPCKFRVCSNPICSCLSALKFKFQRLSWASAINVYKLYTLSNQLVNFCSSSGVPLWALITHAPFNWPLTKLYCPYLHHPLLGANKSVSFPFQWGVYPS